MNLNEIKYVYFVGIGGIGMSSIARYFNHLNKKVLGYDKTKTTLTQNLENENIKVHYDENLENIPNDLTKNNSLIVYTPAIPSQNIELKFFFDNGFEVLKRAQVLGIITKNTFSLAVAGTHGKTTTTSILGHIMQRLDSGTTSFLGGILEENNSNLILGKGDITVVEADEFDRSFLNLSPDIVAITSMDADHLDIYGDKNEFENTFREFTKCIKKDGKIIVKKGLDLKHDYTYSISENADFMAKNIVIENGNYIFDVITPFGKYENISLPMPGRHNVENALAAIAIANFKGYSLDKISKAISDFKGIERRFSTHYKGKNGIYIDDYAHHPTELKATISSVKEMYPQRKILGVFQPHLFSRTRDFVDNFAESLSLLDELILLEIYPARELPIDGVTSSWLLEKVDLKNKQLSSKVSLISDLKDKKFDVLLTLGAGDIGAMTEEITKFMKNEA